MAAPTIKISALPAAASALATDQLETNQGGSTKRITLQQVRTYTLQDGSWLPLTGGTLNGQLNITTLVTGASTPALNINQEWNNAATGFTAFNLNVTNTASAAGSYLAQFMIGGVPQVWLSKTGSLGLAGSGAVAAAQLWYWTGRSIMSSPADGQIRLTDQAQTSFSRLQFGGTTSAFPAIKRTSTQLEMRLADDSGYASAGMSTITLSPALAAEVVEGGQIDWKTATAGTYNLTTDMFNNTWRAYGIRKSDSATASLWTMNLDGTGWAITSPVTLTGTVTSLSATAVGAGANTQAFIKASSTANLGLYYGTGAPTFTAAKGSFYSNTTATTTTTRLYVNTDGGTTWASLTTSA